VIARALQAGVEAIIIVGENLDNARHNIELAREYPCLKPAGGLSLEYADSLEAGLLAEYIMDNRDKFWAIGEVGLDFWIAGEDEVREMPRQVFRHFINLIGDLDLPLNVHSRSAGHHTVAMLLDHGATRVQMHAFDGKASAALPAVEAGYYFSIPPSVSRSRQKQKLLKHLPLSYLLAESDSPVLGPDPSRRNEPANIIPPVRTIAEIKNIPFQQVVEAIRENTHKLYGL